MTSKQNTENTENSSRSPSPTPIRKKKVVTLAESGGLPPTSEEDEVLGDDEAPARDVEVMSEPPEIDTSRFDGPPLILVCGMRCRPCVVRTVFILSVLLLLPVLALGMCIVVNIASQNAPTMAQLVNRSKEITTELCNAVHDLC